VTNSRGYFSFFFFFLCLTSPPPLSTRAKGPWVIKKGARRVYVMQCDNTEARTPILFPLFLPFPPPLFSRAPPFIVYPFQDREDHESFKERTKLQECEFQFSSSLSLFFPPSSPPPPPFPFYRWRSEKSEADCFPFPPLFPPLSLITPLSSSAGAPELEKTRKPRRRAADQERDRTRATFLLLSFVSSPLPFPPHLRWASRLEEEMRIEERGN